MTDWMMETLIWTAVLIAFVLLVRRPVSRAFGPQIAYALWALPALRLVLPPIELPAWMRLSEPAPIEPSAISEAQIIAAFELPTARSENAVVVHPAATDTTAPLTQTPFFNLGGFDTGMLVELGVSLWLIGAATFLFMRFSAYFRLRDELLQEGREVGRSGSIRFVETPGTRAPLAFGVIDKVVALPDGFLARPDRQSRDLALAHELAHHRGGDLLANILVQPLFAIHWWNPLGRYGWLALRRDQEAACDARVMASAHRDEREVYANLIVSFAAGPNVALAAPMACPVLGDKSIVHRLRSLKMDNTNTKRRLAGKVLLGAAVIALPMTASISYAASEAPLAPAFPKAPSVSVTSSAFPAAPLAPLAPEPPTAPEAPGAPLVDDQIIVVDPDIDVSSVDTNGKNVFVVKPEKGEGNVRFAFRQLERMPFRFNFSDFPRGRPLDKETMLRFIERSSVTGAGQLSEEEIEEILEEVREGLEQANEVLEELPEIIEKAEAEAEEARGRAGRRVVRVEQSCKDGDKEIVTTTELDDGSQVIRLCQKRVMVQALEGLREARTSIKTSNELSGADRERALREIDRVISRWEREAR